jgi:lon-related putative ATP-dependent protease
MPIQPLPVASLYRRTELSALEFKTTRDLEDVDALVGQERALGAVRFAARMPQRGYNLFVIGPKGSGKHAAVRTYLAARAGALETPSDWVYVNNFVDQHAPTAIQLPAGQAMLLRDKMAELVQDLRTTAPTLFEGEDFRLKLDAINKEVGHQQEQLFEKVGEEATARGLSIVRTPQGLAIAPVKDGEPMPQEAFQQLPEEERKTLTAAIAETQELLREAMQQAPLLERERMRRVRETTRAVAAVLVEREVAEARAPFLGHGALDSYFQSAATDMIENIHLFVKAGHASPEQPQTDAGGTEQRSPTDDGDALRRYGVNVLVCHDSGSGAPVTAEDHPSLGRLVGRIEHRARLGTMLTDFTLIKPGALHAANGGYLLVNAERLLSTPASWDALKRALYAGAVTIESPYDSIATATMVTLQPDPIPLDVKVVLFGDQRIHLMLSALDPDFQDLFKVAADFETEFDRGGENDRLYAQQIATIVRRNNLRHFDKRAVARVIEHGARLAGDAAKMTARIGLIADVMREANYWGKEARHSVITAGDVERAIQAQDHRADRVRERMIEQITRGTVLIATDGEAVGQVNGLSVLSIGGFSFGRPTRISASVRVGTGRVVDIEREVELGGPLHSKGVLILSSYLSAHYALDWPISLAASLTFEQSYGGVDGDSASSTELYALLSALSGLPIRQSLAVTGSVNQMGEVQAIGGANEKIEGFFDVCLARGLTSSQGVLVPASNVEHLMLRQDVVEACAKGRFRIFAVTTIAEGIELLTGVPAGERGADGSFPEGTVNRAVEDRLIAFAQSRRRFARSTEE